MMGRRKQQSSEAMVVRKREKEREREKEEEEEGREKEEEKEEEAKNSRPYFFKVFFPKQSTDRLRIPPAFNRHLENEPPGVISLKGPSDNTWRAELVSDSEELFFVNGWKEFVIDHSIKIGDVLVFCYDGHSQFSVLLFDATACEKQSAFLAQPCKDVVCEKQSAAQQCKDVVVKIEDDEGDIDINAAGTSKTLALPLAESIETTGKRIREMDDLMANGSPLKKCSAKRRHGSSFGTSKATDSTSLNSMKDSSSSKLDENISCSKSAKSLSLQLRKNNDVPRRGKNIIKRQRTPVVISQRRPVTEEEKDCTVKRAMEFKSKNPFAVQIMKESYVYVGFFMNVPCEFVRESLPRTSKRITLWDPQGKPWEVNYVYYSDRAVGSFSGGWGAFSIGNNLEKFDVCIFELIEKDNLKVHIYRVVSETTPFLRSSSKK